jgi:hypothetical protein
LLNAQLEALMDSRLRGNDGLVCVTQPNADNPPQLRHPSLISVIPAKAGIHPRLPSAPRHPARLHVGNGRRVVA